MCDAASPAADPAEATQSAPLCQEVPVSAEVSRLFEEVGVQAAAGVEDLDANEAERHRDPLQGSRSSAEEEAWLLDRAAGRADRPRSVRLS